MVIYHYWNINWKTINGHGSGILRNIKFLSALYPGLYHSFIALLEHRKFSQYSTPSPGFLSHDSTFFSRHSTGNPSSFLNVPFPLNERSHFIIFVGFSQDSAPSRTHKSAPNEQRRDNECWFFSPFHSPPPSYSPIRPFLNRPNVNFRVES